MAHPNLQGLAELFLLHLRSDRLADFVDLPLVFGQTKQHENFLFPGFVQGFPIEPWLRFFKTDAHEISDFCREKIAKPGAFGQRLFLIQVERSVGKLGDEGRAGKAQNRKWEDQITKDLHGLFGQSYADRRADASTDQYQVEIG